MPTDCEVEALPLFESALPDWEHPDDKSPSATAARYLAMAEAGRQTLCTIAERFERDTGPFFVHCAAGRDRTGIVVACLLWLVGTTDDRIVADYALSDLVVADGGRAHPETMAEFLRLVRGRYGSAEEFLSR